MVDDRSWGRDPVAAEVVVFLGRLMGEFGRELVRIF